MVKTKQSNDDPKPTLKEGKAEKKNRLARIVGMYEHFAFLCVVHRCLDKTLFRLL